jgi:hypothetical protein
MADLPSGGVSTGKTDCDASQSISHFGGGDGQNEKLAGAGAHTPHYHFLFSLRRKDYHSPGAIVADTLHYIEGQFRVAVQVDDDDVVMLLQHLGHLVEVGRVGSKLLNAHPRALGKNTGYLLAAWFVRADQRYGQGAGALGAVNFV